MFVRVKKAKSRTYAYLVENEWTPWGSRQRVTKYLGKLVSLQRTKNEAHEMPNGFKETILSAVEQELHNHGFTNNKQDNILVNVEQGVIVDAGKKVVLGMNEGYLCDHTLHQLLVFTPAENPNENANKLANLAVEAGLKLTNEQFLHLFEQVNKRYKGAEIPDQPHGKSP